MENDLISRSALLRKKYEIFEPEDLEALFSRDFTHKVVSVEDVKKAPTVDAVPVVRCKDCRFYEPGVEYYGGGTKDVCRLLKRQMVDDDFCSYGERRDER